MAGRAFDLVRANYDLSKPLDAARLQRTSMEFMRAVRCDAFHDVDGARLMDDYCKFISSTHVWHLAQNVIPEFRSDPGTSEKYSPHQSSPIIDSNQAEAIQNVA